MWDLGVSSKASFAYDEAVEHADYALFPNRAEIDEQLRLLRLAHDGLTPAFDDVRVPDGFMQPHLVLPPELWSHLLHINGHWFLSRPLRQAMALPDEAAQFMPIELETTSDALRQKDYHWMAWLNIEYDVVDAECSDCDWEKETWATTGEIFRRVSYPRRMVMREGFRPRFDLFRPFEAGYIKCATPALEQRVRESGCIGLGFRAFGTRFGAPCWVSDEGGLHVRQPDEVVDVSPPETVRSAEHGLNPSRPTR